MYTQTCVYIRSQTDDQIQNDRLIFENLNTYVGSHAFWSCWRLNEFSISVFILLHLFRYQPRILSLEWIDSWNRSISEKNLNTLYNTLYRFRCIEISLNCSIKGRCILDSIFSSYANKYTSSQRYYFENNEPSLFLIIFFSFLFF